MDKKQLGKRINTARKDRGMTGEKLSELCGINATYLRQIEGGVKVPSLPVFVSLCRELKVTPSYLLTEVLEADSEIEDYEILLKLFEDATPSQIKLVTAMVKSALDVISEP